MDSFLSVGQLLRTHGFFMSRTNKRSGMATQKASAVQTVPLHQGMRRRLLGVSECNIQGSVKGSSRDLSR